MSTDVGRIDVLAEDKNGDLVVIELKVGVADDRAVSQILSYKSWVKRRLAEGKRVRGIIVAGDFDDRVKYAVADVPDIRLKKYRVKFLFEDVEVED